MPIVDLDGLPTRYETVGEGPAVLMFSPGGFDSSLENWTSFGRYTDLGFVGALVNGFSQSGTPDNALYYDLPQHRAFWRTAEALVFRATQEALRNVVKHAGASHVAVAVWNEEGCVHLRVTDDGHGFDPASLPETGAGDHVGLRLLGDLAADAGGSLRIESAPGAGTTLTLEVPES